MRRVVSRRSRRTSRRRETSGGGLDRAIVQGPVRPESRARSSCPRRMRSPRASTPIRCRDADACSSDRARPSPFRTRACGIRAAESPTTAQRDRRRGESHGIIAAARAMARPGATTAPPATTHVSPRRSARSQTRRDVGGGGAWPRASRRAWRWRRGGGGRRRSGSGADLEDLPTQNHARPRSSDQPEQPAVAAEEVEACGPSRAGGASLASSLLARTASRRRRRSGGRAEQRDAHAHPRDACRAVLRREAADAVRMRRDRGGP